MNQKAKEEWDKKQAEEADKNKKQTEVFHNLHLIWVLRFCYKFEYIVVCLVYILALCNYKLLEFKLLLREACTFIYQCHLYFKFSHIKD